MPKRSEGPPIEGKCDVDSCNYLLLGSDSRTGLPRGQRSDFGTTASIDGERSDVIILVHVDPRTNHATIVHFPRDLWVHIPGHGENKINAAFYGGLSNHGPELVASTVTRLTGLKINHVIYVDLAKFEGVVSALDGVPMCITTRMVDSDTGLDLYPGCQTLDAQQALAFVRTRKQPCEFIGDFARIARQQQFLRAVMAKALSPAQLPHAASITKSVAKNIVTDPDFNLGEVIYLVSKLQGLTTGLADFRVVPVSTDKLYPGGVLTDIDRLAQPQANEMFKDLHAGKPLGNLGIEQPATALSPAVIDVTVYDHHSGTKALGAVHVLQEGGFNVASVPIEPPDLKPIPTGNVILYGGKDGAAAGVVQAYLPSAREVQAKKGQLPAGQEVAAVITSSYTQKPLGHGPTSCAPTP